MIKPAIIKVYDELNRKPVQVPLRINYHAKARELAKVAGMYPGFYMANLLEDALDKVIANAVNEFERTKIVPNPVAQRN